MTKIAEIFTTLYGLSPCVSTWKVFLTRLHWDIHQSSIYTKIQCGKSKSGDDTASNGRCYGWKTLDQLIIILGDHDTKLSMQMPEQSIALFSYDLDIGNLREINMNKKPTMLLSRKKTCQILYQHISICFDCLPHIRWCSGILSSIRTTSPPTMSGR